MAAIGWVAFLAFLIAGYIWIGNCSDRIMSEFISILDLNLKAAGDFKKAGSTQLSYSGDVGDIPVEVKCLGFYYIEVKLIKTPACIFEAGRKPTYSVDLLAFRDVSRGMGIHPSWNGDFWIRTQDAAKVTSHFSSDAVKSAIKKLMDDQGFEGIRSTREFITGTYHASPNPKSALNFRGTAFQLPEISESIRLLDILAGVPSH